MEESKDKNNQLLIHVLLIILAIIETLILLTLAGVVIYIIFKYGLIRSFIIVQC